MPRNKKPRTTHLPHNKRVQKKMKMIESLNPFVSNHIKKLEAENETLKNNPDTVVGQLIPQLRDTINANKRLSVLAAALIEAQGGKVNVPKEVLTSFESKVLNIKWELPEGVESAENADTFIFTYNAITPEQPEVTVTPEDPSGEGATVETGCVHGIPLELECPLCGENAIKNEANPPSHVEETSEELTEETPSIG